MSASNQNFANRFLYNMQRRARKRLAWALPKLPWHYACRDPKRKPLATHAQTAHLPACGKCAQAMAVWGRMPCTSQN